MAISGYEEFLKERNIAIQQMIDEKKMKWDSVEEVTQQIKDKIGKIIAEIDYWEASGNDKTPKYNDLIDQLEKLNLTYNNHLNENKDLAKQLNKEIAILENLL
jgi:chromosome segregation ATPase